MVQIGVVFPQTESGTDTGTIRAYTQAANDLGFQHMVAYDHVVTTGPSHPDTYAYGRQLFHEPFVLFGYLAALTEMELVPAVIILPQRQTALVAKQAAEIDILTKGKFRLGIGVGWIPAEFEALGVNFNERGRIMNEQMEALRLLWTQETVTYHGKYITLNDVGLNPMPLTRPIPLWLGGSAEPVLRRLARLGDGWFPQGTPEQNKPTLERLRRYFQEAGRDPSTLGIEGRINATDGTPDTWRRLAEGWRDAGATHLCFSTMNAGYTSIDQHIEAIRRFKEAVSDL
ncbi:putative F420-dependent oxidoreductase [Thermosporothrix hazakensis]|jgi:probable F420-dependent oxidoreductase|uniref:Luciferase-like domain-containing protein n=2 Tax=Thermosporothrix TaxID=768650 RepID=A0A455SAX1_9CHLR|nr:LLM class F420-dependent oxidoreductase [Thermosporothrix hazakensis]PZW34482.1 putative F420-dependent oxidoreductase [Thermosporothrix hazakensis]BBH85603.1 hypothetical protein KTC_03540 [Thermosporothrix sp. COM3]GCE45969.1 hypothetical protein KTH_08380 [Thermosporothrix hazakensis]